MTDVTGQQYEVFGVDVSHWQDASGSNPLPDWDKAKEANLFQLAFVKATEGQSDSDEEFAYNWAVTKGLFARRAYHFLRARRVATSGIKQAENFFEELSKAKDLGELQPAIDVETNDENLNRTEFEGLVWKFLNRFKELSGKDCIIYTRKYVWDPYLAMPPNGGTDIPRNRELWVANYGVSAPHLPWDWEKRYGANGWTYWQPGTKTIPGFKSPIDWDIYNGSLTQFNAKYGLNIQPVNVPAPPPPPPPDKLPASVKIKGLLAGEELNIRGVIWGDVLAKTFGGNGRIYQVEAQAKDKLGRTWYQIGKSLWIASWYCDPIY